MPQFSISTHTERTLTSLGTSFQVQWSSSALRSTVSVALLLTKASCKLRYFDTVYTAHTKFWYRSSDLLRSFFAFFLLWKALQHHHQLHHHQLHHHQLLWLLPHQLRHQLRPLQLWLLLWLHQHRDRQLSAMTPLLITPHLHSLYQLAPNILLILLFFHSKQPLLFLVRTAPFLFIRHPLHRLVWLITVRTVLESTLWARLSSRMMGRFIRFLFHLPLPSFLERRLLWFKTLLWRLL